MRLLLILLSFSLTCCVNQTYEVEDFTTDKLIWYKPFTKIDSVIFTSENGEKDTIIFTAPETKSDSIRSLEQGFSNTNYLTVSYEFSKGSYHQSAMMGDGKTRYPHWFVNSFNSSSGYGGIEITFIGTFFSDSLKNIQKINDTTYFFESEKADYSGMNVENEIKNFTFNTRKGIIDYVDNRDIKWKRE